MRFLAFVPLLTASLLACTPGENTTTDSSTGSATSDGSSTGSTTDSSSTGSSTDAATEPTSSTTGEPPDTSTSEATTSTTDATSSSTGEPVDDCDFLAFKLFESDDELECGLGPNGVELCHWTISFTEDNYEHQYSDIGEQGTYTCEGGVIKAIDGGQNPHGGTIDADTGALVWDGVAYHQFI